MVFEEVNPLFVQAMEEFQKVEKLYLTKFGEKALDRVLLYDPLGIQQHPEDILAATDKLKKAIEKNKPIEQISREMWNKLIF